MIGHIDLSGEIIILLITISLLVLYFFIGFKLASLYKKKLLDNIDSDSLSVENYVLAMAIFAWPILLVLTIFSLIVIYTQNKTAETKENESS